MNFFHKSCPVTTVSMELASGIGKSYSIDYKYNNINIQFTMKKIKNKTHLIVVNNEINLDHEVSFYIDHYVKKVDEEYANAEDYGKLLNSLIDPIKRLLPSPPPDHMNPPMLLDFYGRDHAPGAQLTTSSMPPNFYEHN
ncbi:unnamed protein product, partial [Rotaria sp. Silwood2]